MSIPENLKRRFAYHFTSLENLDSIIEHGLLCTNMKNARNIGHVNVAEQGIQGRRSNMYIPCSGNKNVHDYVPFYFSKKTSMQLGVINKKNIDQNLIIYLSIPIELIEQRNDIIFTDASANTDIPPNFYNTSNSQQLNTLNWDAIDSKKWGCPSEEFRHQKMAELLVPEAISITDISHIIVWNEGIKAEVEKVFSSKGMICPPIKSDADHYYINFYDGGRQSIVTGPVLLKHFVDETIKEIKVYAGGGAKYPDLKTTLEAVTQNFSSIKELYDIDGLNANYGPHRDDVGTHCRKVAAAVSESPEYQNLSQVNKDILKLSAYLHDIGKGPKSRWPSARMTKADNDHARKSLPMLKRILTEDVAKLDHESVRKLVTLVTYDDLVGDIVAKGRNEQQLFDIITCEDDVHMLVALGKADMVSINLTWVILNNHSIEELKRKAIASLGNG